MADPVLHCLPQASFRTVEVIAAESTTRNNLPADYRADFEQESLLALWKKRTAFDPRRGSWRTFSEVVVTNKMRSILRRIQLERGTFAGNMPLRHRALRVPPDLDCELRLDVQRVLATMSMVDREVALSLSSRSPVETSRYLCIPRGKVYRAISRLRQAFTSAGFPATRRGCSRGGAR